MRNISKKGLECLKNHEGLRLKVYKDSADYPTIGVGHLLTSTELACGSILIKGEMVPYLEGITEEQALNLLEQDARHAISVVNSSVKVALTQNQFDALVSLAFNIGNGAFHSSTLVKKLNTGEYSSVPYEMRRWRKAGGKINPGLVKRREEEIKLWLGQTTERRKGELKIVNDNGDEISLKGNWRVE